MSIHFISGKPGGGKTLYSVRLIIDELVNGNRCVITNVPLKHGELNRLLQDKYPAAYERRFIKTGRTIMDDVFLLDEDQLPKFFTFRSGNVMLESVTNQEWKTGKRPDFSVVKDGGVFYVLDEVHIAFNARAWAETGHEVLYYLSQHRKLGDDVICITQAIGNVDKQFRSVAQDFTYIKNLSKQKAGLFRLPAIFTRNTYAQPATDNSKAMETGSFTMDVSGIASCYDTAKGVGIHGRAGADTNSRKKGIHWLWFVILCPVLIWLLFQYLPTIIAHITTPKIPPSVHTVVTTNAPVLQDTKPATPSEVPEHRASVEQPTNELFCTGYMISPGRDPEVNLSDGSTAGPPELELIAKRFVIVSGRKIPIRLTPAWSEYVPQQVTYDPPPPAPPMPVNQADVTVIGQRQREPVQTPRGSGFARMAGK